MGKSYSHSNLGMNLNSHTVNGPLMARHMRATSHNTKVHFARLLCSFAGLFIGLTTLFSQQSPGKVTLSAEQFRFDLEPGSGKWELTDLKTSVTWRSNPSQPRFGEITIERAGKRDTVPLDKCQAESSQRSLMLTFSPVANDTQARVHVQIRAAAPDTLEVSYDATPGLTVHSIRLLDRAMWITDGDRGYVVVPVREGLLIPSNSRVEFTRSFDTYAYEGCHMAMLGLVKSGSAALLTWNDPYVLAEVRSVTKTGTPDGNAQSLMVSMVLSKTARAFSIRLLGHGDYVAIANAYRDVAAKRGWLVPWEKKLADHPERAKLFGAINYKLWSALDRQMNEDSTREQRVRVNWTFDEAAAIAEHLYRDLDLKRVLFLMGGWIHRGYDNQHPDILPAAPECGGDQGLTDCARRVMKLGYVFGLHDNYQDIYRDSPSWDESLIMKAPDGSLVKGGHWAGGRAYLTCSQKALELAQRPQNLPAVQKLTRANAYFIDTTYAAGLQECFDPKHPLTRQDDMKWKQALSDYARSLFGIFGSECGREWALPHSDFFEGLTGVSGHAYHDANLVQSVGGSVVPLFELVYRDCIAMYGKYGYDPASSAEYVLQHLIFGRPLHYHNIPAHLYWKESVSDTTLAVRPLAPEVDVTGPRELEISYQWQIEKPPGDDWHVFVHFTDYRGTNVFQNDHVPRTPTSKWTTGRMESGAFTLHLPEKLKASVDVRVGWWQPNSGKRALLRGVHDGSRRYIVGRLDITDTGMRWFPVDETKQAARPDPALFVRADNGWADGLHPLDRFVKNTYEILSPLHELTATVPMTRHEFLTPDRLVQRSNFGSGENTLSVTANFGPNPIALESPTGGDVLLPPYGFVVESPMFVAFCALTWNGLSYSDPSLFALRSLDGRPLEKSEQIRVFHGFGDTRVKLGNRVCTVVREEIVRPASSR